MKDHVHLLVKGLADTSDFRRFMTIMRQRSATVFSARFKERLWQRGYHERVLRNSDEAPGVIAYIEANPVKEGLVSKPTDYPFVWSPTLTDVP